MGEVPGLEEGRALFVLVEETDTFIYTVNCRANARGCFLSRAGKAFRGIVCAKRQRRKW